MRNPFRSESDAFAFVLSMVVAFALTAAASMLGGWQLGVPVLLAATLGAILVHRGEAGPAERVEPLRHPDGERRILVVANETVGDDALVRKIRRSSESVAEHVLVVAPALNTHVRHWTSDEDGARAEARQRLDDSLARLRAAGLRVEGRVGEDDPLQAIEDALRTFGADEIIISTHPSEQSNWLERGVVDSARRRFTPPVTHVVAV